MKQGDIVTIVEDALCLYSSPVSSIEQEFVIININSYIVEIRLLLKDSSIDWRTIEAIPKSLIPVGRGKH